MSASDWRGQAAEAVRRRALHMQDANLLDEACESILDAVEPIIRADEQMQAESAWRDKMEARIRADERERVANAMHGLSTDGAGWVLLRDVWTTITRLGGESDE